MNFEKNKFLKSLIFPVSFLSLLWIIEIIQYIFHLNFAFLGIYPLRLKGLIGIITSPLIHENFSHLFSNSIPLLILGTTLFYFYQGISYKIFFYIYLLTGIWVWLGAREAYHIGASGLIYGLASFLFFSGIIRKDFRLLSISLIVAFLYGSAIWGMFPGFFPKKNISWESHLFGAIAGIVLAFYYKNNGPKPKKYSWEYEEEDEEDDDENAYWKINTDNNSINNKHKGNPNNLNEPSKNQNFTNDNNKIKIKYFIKKKSKD